MRTTDAVRTRRGPTKSTISLMWKYQNRPAGAGSIFRLVRC